MTALSVLFFWMQVFKTFIEGFGTAYQPLLTEIQQAFDASIQQGLHDAMENSALRQQLLAAGRQQAAAEAQVTAEVIQGRCYRSLYAACRYQ